MTGTNVLKKLWPSGIRSQLILGIASILVVLMSLLVWQLMDRQKKFLYKFNHERALGLSTTLASTANSYVISYELAGLQKLVSTYKNNPGLQYAMVTSDDGIVLAHTDPKYLGLKAIDSVSTKLKPVNATQTLLENNGISDIATPIIDHDKIVGWARIGLSGEYIASNLKSIRKEGLLFILISLVVGSIFSIIISGRLSKGLKKMVTAAGKIKAGNRNLRVSPSGSRELTELGTAFNEMLDKISKNEKLLSLVLENMPVGVFILDEHGKVVTVNPAAQRIWEGAKYIGEGEYNVYKGWFPDGKEIGADEWGMAIALHENRAILNQEAEIEAFDGSRKTIINSCLPLHDTNGKISGAIAINVDITERKQTEKKKLEMLEFESLLSKIATNLVQVQNKQLSHAISNSQRLICEFLNLDLSSIYQPLSETGSQLKLNYVYHRSENLVVPEILIASEYFPWCEKELLAGNIPVVNSMNDLPAEAARDRESWDHFGVKSSAMFPMIAANGEFLGTISFDAMQTECHFTDELINRLKLIATLFANVIKRSQVEIELTGSKEQMRLFIEHSPASLAMFDTEMRYIATSRRWKTAYNLGDQDIIGKTHYEIFPEIEQEWKDIHQRCLKGAIEKRDEDSFTRHDGTTEWLRWEIRPWHKASGEIGGIIMFTEVITEQKESELKFKNLVEKSLIGVYILQKGKFVYVNPKFAELLSYTQEEMLNMEDARQIVYQDDKAIASEQWRKRLEDGVIDIHAELRYQGKDGKVIWAEVNSNETLYKGTKAVIGTFQDITDRKNAEMVLIDSEEKQRLVLNGALDAIISINAEGRVTSWNPQAEKIFGWSEKEILNRFLSDTIIPDQHKEAHISGMKNYLKYGKHKVLNKLMELSAVNKNNDEFPIELNIIPIVQGQSTFFTAFIRDITTRKEAENKLKESEEKFRSLVEETLVGVFILQDEQIVYANPGFEKICGYSNDELLNRMNFQQLIYEGDADWVKGNYELRISGEKPSDEYLFRAIKKDGSIIHVDIIVSRIIYNNKPAVIGSVIDRTHQVEEDKRIGRAVTDAQEKERTQIGMELHDNVKQLMAASLMGLDLAKKIIDNKKGSIEIIDNVRGYIRDSISELRRLSHQLAPAVDDEKGTLIEKIEKLINDSKISDKMEVFLDIEEFDKPINAEIQLAFYRILQEQFNNIIKYSKASGVLIRVKEKDGKLNMSIKDDGAGFDTTTKKDGIGLENIRRRINTLNGDTKIISSPGEGCEVKVSVPFS